MQYRECMHACMRVSCGTLACVHRRCQILLNYETHNERDDAEDQDRGWAIFECMIDTRTRRTTYRDTKYINVSE